MSQMNSISVNLETLLRTTHAFESPVAISSNTKQCTVMLLQDPISEQVKSAVQFDRL